MQMGRPAYCELMVTYLGRLNFQQTSSVPPISGQPVSRNVGLTVRTALSLYAIPRGTMRHSSPAARHSSSCRILSSVGRPGAPGEMVSSWKSRPIWLGGHDGSTNRMIHWTNRLPHRTNTSPKLAPDRRDRPAPLVAIPQSLSLVAQLANGPTDTTVNQRTPTDTEKKRIVI